MSRRDVLENTDGGTEPPDRTPILEGTEDDEVLCRECYEALGQITASHLSLHGLTTEEYREKHPDAPFQSEEVREDGGWSDDTHGDDTSSKISESISEKHERGEYSDADA